MLVSSMRAAVLSCLCSVALLAQVSDPAYEPLTRAYAALRARDYDAAIAGFLQGIAVAPDRVAIRKDLGYTYLKVGENDLARDQFEAAMRVDAADEQVAMEYAFLCFETKKQAEARRVFDRVRKSGNATAEQAFQNIDGPLAAGIDRWQKAIAMGSDSFSAHFELATLAEQRDELALAAEHFQKAWKLLPDRRSVLVDLGRVWKSMGLTERANAALLAASRGGEPRAAEMAKELLPDRYPFVNEFRSALELDPANAELRRELGYLLLRMERQDEAEAEFRTVTEIAPDDLLSATQLGFLLHARGQDALARPLFERVLAGSDDDLANRVRAVLRMPQVLRKGPEDKAQSIDAKVMAERSIKAGYMQDALRYLKVAQESDPGDFDVMLKLGWTYNILHQDSLAYRWFRLAEKSQDSRIASQADEAARHLRQGLEPVRVSVWLYPLYSLRWSDLFSYAQVRADLRVAGPIQPYASVRIVGDARGTIGVFSPQYLSESSLIFAVGARTKPWNGVTGWFEAGNAVGYHSGHALPDYRGGVSAARSFGRTLGSESGGWFADSTLDGVFVSRFGNDFIVYSQTRGGYTAASGGLRAQFYWSANLTLDSQQQYWAQFAETGPGIRWRDQSMPASMWFSLQVLRGAYLVNAGNPRRPNFDDVRAGVWYAFSL